MCSAGESPEPYGADAASTERAFTALLNAEDLYESAPCESLVDSDGRHRHRLGWLGLESGEMVGRIGARACVGGKLLRDPLRAAAADEGRDQRHRVEMEKGQQQTHTSMVSSAVKHGSEGEPLLIRAPVFDASDRPDSLRRGTPAPPQAGGRAGAPAGRANRARLKEALAALQQSLLPARRSRCRAWRRPCTYHTAAPDRLGGDFYDLFA